MTAKEFVTKHYSSLSAGVFAVGLLAVLAIYGGGFSAMGGPATPPTVDAQQAPPTVNGAAPAVSPLEQVPADDSQDESAAKSETAEDDQDPLEKAMADEQAKATERREQIREEINKDREAAGLPLLPALGEEGSSGE